MRGKPRSLDCSLRIGWRSFQEGKAIAFPSWERAKNFQMISKTKAIHRALTNEAAIYRAAELRCTRATEKVLDFTVGFIDGLKYATTSWLNAGFAGYPRASSLWNSLIFPDSPAGVFLEEEVPL